MRFRFPSDTDSHSLSKLHYQLLVIDFLANMTSLFWLGVLFCYLRFWERLEYGPILYGVTAVFVASIIVAVPYCFIASRCLFGPWENPIGPLSMLFGGHDQWLWQWQTQVVGPNERLSQEVNEARDSIAEVSAIAKEERLKGEDLEHAARIQQQLLLKLFREIPSAWEHGCLFYGEIRNEFSSTFVSDRIEWTAKTCMANLVLRVFSVFHHVIVFRSGPTDLVLLLDHRGGGKDTKVRVTITLEQLGGRYQWRLNLMHCYFYLPGFRRTAQGSIPSRGDVKDVRRLLLGDPLSAPFRVGLLSLVNPLNALRCVNLFQGVWFRAERDWSASSDLYFENNFLGHGEFTDLALIGKYRQQVLSRGKGYQGPAISTPDEETKKITQQFTATILQVTLGAIREALDPESIGDGSSPLLRSNSAA